MITSNNFLKIAVLICGLSLFYSCTKKSNGAGTLTPETMDSLQTFYGNINTQMDQAWVAMMVDDDGKTENLKRLLQEVVYSGAYNKAKVDSLNQKVDALLAMRYDQETMADSDLIDRYDIATEDAIEAVTDYVTSLPKFTDYPTMAMLLEEIQESEEKVLSYRMEYDRNAKLYNQFISENSQHLGAIGVPSNPSPKPLFELSSN